jgi:hypothetical protein
VYTPNDFTPVDALAHLRKNPSMYFRSGQFSALEMATRLVGEAILRGAQKVSVDRDGEWYLVSADVDWLAEIERDPFNEVIPFPEAGANSMLQDVLLTAFAGDVFTVASGELRKIKGGSPLPDYDQLEPAGRIVGFRG